MHYRHKCPISNTGLCLRLRRRNTVYQLSCDQQYTGCTTRLIHDRVRECINNENSSARTKTTKALMSRQEPYFCHGVFTDRSIFSLNLSRIQIPRGTSVTNSGNHKHGLMLTCRHVHVRPHCQFILTEALSC